VVYPQYNVANVANVAYGMKTGQICLICGTIVYYSTVPDPEMRQVLDSPFTVRRHSISEKDTSWLQPGLLSWQDKAKLNCSQLSQLHVKILPSAGESLRGQRENSISIRVPKESLVLATQGRCAPNGVAWFIPVICHVFWGSIFNGIDGLELSGE